MNPSVLIGWLESDSANDRRRAARHLANENHPSCLDSVRVAFQKEDIPWVKNAMAQALESYEEPVESQNDGFSGTEIDENEVASIESNAINESIGQVLHELEPAIGRLKVVAQETIGNFDTSKLKTEFDNLDQLLETFENWRKVEQSPVNRKVMVRGLLQGVVEQIQSHLDHAVDIQLLTSEEIGIITDVQLLRIVVSNALRNSVDATNAVGNEKPVLVSYGLTDKVFWISIVDSGIGLPPNQKSIFKSKVSTKPGHRGMGLAIVDKAVLAIDGEWDLKNGKAGGTEFYLTINQGSR